jgi:hypothetical protein
VLGLSSDEVVAIRDAATLLRVRRTRQTQPHGAAAEARRPR